MSSSLDTTGVKAGVKAIFQTLDSLIESCDIDNALLQAQTIDAKWLKDYNNQRIVNSFLFNYIKIQDKLGANLVSQIAIY